MPRIASLLITLTLFAAAPAVQAGQQLIVFLQPESAVDKDFEQTKLPKIREMAKEKEIEVIVKDATKGAPGEVTLTPMLVYQNHRGRSIYQGRSTTLERVENFLRTSRFVPQGEENLKRTNLPVWDLERMQVASPIKITELAGTQPSGFDQEDFASKAKQAMAKGFGNFTLHETAELRRGDRSFYMDFYPYRGEDGKFFLSLALFSQFHCKDPVFKTTEAIAGQWSNWDKVFAEAGKVMERAVKAEFTKPDSGDAFTPVAKAVAVKSWSDLGLDLPEAAAQQRDFAAADLSLGQSWTVVSAGENDPPSIMYRFPAPLDNYTGVVSGVSGNFTFGSGLSIEGSKGKIIADPKTIVMGDPDLDSALQTSVFLHTKKYPESTFVIESMSSEDESIAFGRMATGSVTGTFTLKGKEVPLTAAFEIEPIVSAEGQPKLLMRGRFTIDVLEFDVESADGPAPANHTLIFDVNLQLKPAARNA